MGLFDNLTDLIPGIGNSFGLPSQGAWNLQKGSFTTPSGSVVFFVESKIGQFPGQTTAIDQISDGGGRRLAKYEYPYIDGQLLADLGRKGETFTFNIKFFGNNYQILFKAFIEKLTRSKDKGTLNHPVRGSFTCRFESWEYVHRHDEWNAVTIKATFIEDNTDQISKLNVFDNVNSLLRDGLQTLSSVATAITGSLAAAAAIKAFPGQVLSSLESGLVSVIKQCSSLLGSLAASYSSDGQLNALFASAVAAGSVLNVNSGTVAGTPNNQAGLLPPVYQVGYSAADQSNITAQINSFVNSNQITPQQALFAANQARAAIAAAIAAIEVALGNSGFSISLQYRILANSIQNTTQSAITQAQSQIQTYVVPTPMSLRMVAFNCGLTSDRQNDIEALNPYLGSVNYVFAGTVLMVPAA